MILKRALTHLKLYTKDEKHGAGVREIVSQVSEQNRNLESEIESHKNIEKANIHMHASLISKRDRLQRTLSLIMERQKKAEEDLALKDKNLSSLESLLVEKQKHLAESKELHDLMKKQKNQFLHMIKATECLFKNNRLLNRLVNKESKNWTVK